VLRYGIESCDWAIRWCERAREELGKQDTKRRRAA
jgi:hypothetical protein